MRIDIRKRLIENMIAGEGYTYRTICKILCPSQSSTAEHLMQDAICAGYLQETKPKDGINRTFRINT